MRVLIHFTAVYQAVPLILQKGVTLTCGLEPSSFCRRNTAWQNVFFVLIFVFSSPVCRTMIFSIKRLALLVHFWFPKNSLIALKTALVIEDPGCQLSVIQDREKGGKEAWVTISVFSNIPRTFVQQTKPRNGIKTLHQRENVECCWLWLCSSSCWSKTAFIYFFRR